jgi:hypothetical protein
MSQRKPTTELPVHLSDSYPNLCRWVADFGTLGIGYSRKTCSFVRALDAGGMVWKGRRRYRSLDGAFSDAEAAIARLLKEELGIEDA